MVFERIDRAVGNTTWQDTYPGTCILHLPKINSDHRPIFIQPWVSTNGPHQVRQFRFMAPWILHAEWDSFVRNNWDHNVPLGDAIAKFTEKVTIWNREVFGNIFQRKRIILARLGGIQKAFETHSMHNLRTLDMELREELDRILFQ